MTFFPLTALSYTRTPGFYARTLGFPTVKLRVDQSICEPSWKFNVHKFLLETGIKFRNLFLITKFNLTQWPGKLYRRYAQSAMTQTLCKLILLVPLCLKKLKTFTDFAITTMLPAKSILHLTRLHASLITDAHRASHAAIILNQAAPNVETRIVCKLMLLVREEGHLLLSYAEHLCARLFREILVRSYYLKFDNRSSDYLSICSNDHHVCVTNISYKKF